MTKSVTVAAVLATLAAATAVAQAEKPVDPGDFRIVAVDRVFNYQRGLATATLEFQRDGRLIYRVRGGQTHRNDLDGRWAFTGSTLCLSIATIDSGVPECGELRALGPDDFEMTTGSHIFR